MRDLLNEMASDRKDWAAKLPSIFARTADSLNDDITKAITGHGKVVDFGKTLEAAGSSLLGGRAIDIVTLPEELARRKEMAAIGGVAYLASLTKGLPRRPSNDEYACIVKDKVFESPGNRGVRHRDRASLRSIRRSAHRARCCRRPGLLEVSERRNRSRFRRDDTEIVRDSFGSVDQLYAHQGDVTGLATHCRQFGAMAAVKDGKVVAVFPWRCRRSSLLRRMLASMAMVSMKRFRLVSFF